MRGVLRDRDFLVGIWPSEGEFRWPGEEGDAPVEAYFLVNNRKLGAEGLVRHDEGGAITGYYRFGYRGQSYCVFISVDSAGGSIVAEELHAEEAVVSLFRYYLHFGGQE